MGYSAQVGQVILRSQSVQGTYQADTATAGIGMKLRTGALGPSRELLIPDPEIGGGRDVVDAYLGAVSWSGDYEMYARYKSLPTLLRAVLGTASSAVTTGVVTDTITGNDTSVNPYLSIEETVSDMDTFRYHDAVANTFHLEAEANGYLMATIGLIAARQVAGNTKSTPTNVDDAPMTVGTNITVTYNGASLPAKSFSLDIANNFEDDDYRLGSFFIGDLTWKRREVTASFSIRHSSAALWRQAVYGTPSATSPGGITTKQQLVITATSYEDIVGGTPATKNSLTLTMPNFVLTPFALEASGDDVLENDIEGQAVRPTTGTGVITAVVKRGGTAATIP
jgi:hypothetical protein